MISEKYLIEARQAIAQAPENLVRNGYRYQTAEENIEPDLCEKSVATALAFLDCGPVTKTSLRSKNVSGSYGLKHQAERWGKKIGFEPYVSNGDMICAALFRRLVTKRDGSNSPNCVIGVKVIHTELT